MLKTEVSLIACLMASGLVASATGIRVRHVATVARSVAFVVPTVATRVVVSLEAPLTVPVVPCPVAVSVRVRVDVVLILFVVSSVLVREISALSRPSIRVAFRLVQTVVVRLLASAVLHMWTLLMLFPTERGLTALTPPRELISSVAMVPMVEAFTPPLSLSVLPIQNPIPWSARLKEMVTRRYLLCVIAPPSRMLAVPIHARHRPDGCSASREWLVLLRRNSIVGPLFAGLSAALHWHYTVNDVPLVLAPMHRPTPTQSDVFVLKRSMPLNMLVGLVTTETLLLTSRVAVSSELLPPVVLWLLVVAPLKPYVF